MSPDVLVAAFLGVGFGAGVLLVITGVRGHDRPQPGRTRRRRLDQRHALRAVGAAAAGIAVGVVSGWVTGAVLAGLAAWTLPRLLGRDREHASRVARIEAIAAWTEMLRDTLASAAGLEQAITASAPIAPAAIRPQVHTLAARLEAGHRLAPALRAYADDLADPIGDLVVSALVLAAEQRARNLGDLLGSLAGAARDQAAMRMRVEAGRARTRTSVRVIAGTTVAFAVGLLVLNREYLSAYDSAVGQLVLLGVGGVFAAGFAWLTRIARPTQPDRFLHTPFRYAPAEGEVAAP